MNMLQEISYVVEKLMRILKDTGVRGCEIEINEEKLLLVIKPQIVGIVYTSRTIENL